jgi:hypothetical protein
MRVSCVSHEPILGNQRPGQVVQGAVDQAMVSLWVKILLYPALVNHEE